MTDKPQFFGDAGVHALSDGQFGSTGKGALAAFLAEQAVKQDVYFKATISNAGPNSGHTFYHEGVKHVLKQLPTFAVATYLMSPKMAHTAFLSAGAIIDPEILAAEATKYPHLVICVDPIAAVITNEDKESEHSGTVQAVAGTRSGTGAALARKVLRDPTAIFRHFWDNNPDFFPVNVYIRDHAFEETYNVWEDRVFLEVSQGFSLGLNSEFYPKVTSRECTIMQGMADARLPARSLEKSYLSMRTFPIRVGDHEGFSSGGYYMDQEETSWGDIGQVPELTTVTQRVRRVFTFSEIQAAQAIAANDPDFVFLNFMNYLEEDKHDMANIVARLNAGHSAEINWLFGWGPETSDITSW